MTDVFRLLTRSATFTRKPVAPAPAPASTLAPTPAPAPAVITPPKTESAKKKKRKPSDIANLIALPQELDFFNMGAPDAKRARVDGEDSEAEVEVEVEVESGDEAEDGGKVQEEEVVLLPTPEDNRAVLRRNKLKFTLLTPPAAAAAAASPPNKKKKKKSKKAPEPEPEPEKKKKKKKLELLVPPLTEFAHLRSAAHGYALSKRVYANILAQGYSAPTEVQMGALPVLMKRNLSIPSVPEDAPLDLLTCAPTGSGKTLAYVVPLLNAILAMKKGVKGVKAVVLAPTKELVGQIVNETKKLAMGTGVRVAVMKKGMVPVSTASAADTTTTTMTTDSAQIKADILVSTPLVLLHALTNADRPDSTTMAKIRTLILDEADVLLDGHDGQFGPQTLGVWQHLRTHSPHLHASLWSATISSSTESTFISTLSAHHIPLRLIVGIKDTSLPTISQSLLYCATERGKLLALRQLFTTSLRPPILIFVQSVPRAQALHSELLYDLPQPGRLGVLHAELTDDTREATMTRFRKGETWVLITTDLLARGIDFQGVRLVVSYDIPTSVAAYIHRVGRTGRAGRGDGKAVTYYTKEDIGYVKPIAQVIGLKKKEEKKKKEKKAGGGGGGGEDEEGEEGEGGGGGGGGVEQWLLDSLPKVGKNERKKLKERGVEARSGGKSRISTKSGYQRKLEDRKKGAREASKKRKIESGAGVGVGGDGSGDESVTGGVDLGDYEEEEKEEEEEEFTGFD